MKTALRDLAFFVVVILISAFAFAYDVPVSSAASEDIIVIDEAEAPPAVGEDTAVAAMTSDVEVISTSGHVEIRPGGGEEFAPAIEGMLLSTGATIKTQGGAYTELGFDTKDNNVVRVEENTSAIILLQGNEKLQLIKGEVLSIIRDLPAGSAFEIRTPTAVIGARGTEWTTKVEGETTEVEAYEDNPYVKQVDAEGQVNPEETIVKKGFSTTVKGSRKPTTLRAIPEIRKQRWNTLRQDIKQRTEAVRTQRGRPRPSGQPGGSQSGDRPQAGNQDASGMQNAQARDGQQRMEKTPQGRTNTQQGQPNLQQGQSEQNRVGRMKDLPQSRAEQKTVSDPESSMRKGRQPQTSPRQKAAQQIRQRQNKMKPSQNRDNAQKSTSGNTAQQRKSTVTVPKK